MMNEYMAAFIVFGTLFAICVIGLFMSNAAAERLDAGDGRIENPDDLRAGSGRAATGLR